MNMGRFIFKKTFARDNNFISVNQISDISNCLYSKIEISESMVNNLSAVKFTLFEFNK